MGEEEDGVSVGWIYDDVGQLGTWGLGRQARSAERVGWSWVGELGLWRLGLGEWAGESRGSGRAGCGES